jgi:hypothetical protein
MVKRWLKPLCDRDKRRNAAEKEKKEKFAITIEVENSCRVRPTQRWQADPISQSGEELAKREGTSQIHRAPKMERTTRTV